MPNNAVLVVAGDFKTDEAKQWIQNTLVISKRTNCRKTNFVEEPITETIRATYEDPNIQIRWL
jgi:predicted Zn-dependent peptidase